MERSAGLRPATYRAFVVNEKGHLGGVPQIIEAHDDVDATRKAETFAEWNAVEIWEGARLVARLAPHCRGEQTRAV